MVYSWWIFRKSFPQLAGYREKTSQFVDFPNRRFAVGGLSLEGVEGIKKRLASKKALSLRSTTLLSDFQATKEGRDIRVETYDERSRVSI